MKFLSRLFRPNRRNSRRKNTTAAAEALESRQLLTVNFQFIHPNNVGAGNGLGFDQPQLGAARRAALVTVGQQLGAEITQNATITLNVTSTFNGGSTLATAGSNVRPTLPTNVAAVPTFGADEVIRQKIITNGATDLNGATVDGTVTVDFGQIQNGQIPNPTAWNFSADPTTITAVQSDFFGVATHELLHALGFNSGITQSGAPLNAGYYKWNQFDQFIQDGAGNNAVNPTSGVVNQTVWAKATGGSSATMLNGQNGLFFAGPNAVAANGGNPVGLYTPATWSGGSSVSHVDDQNPAYASSRILAANGNGPSVRGLSAIDRGVLQDLGYNLAPNSIVVTETNGTQVTEGGVADTFTVQLSSQPTANVALSVVVATPTIASVNSNTLTFTPQNWNVPQTVTVSGVMDNFTGQSTSMVYVNVNSGAPEYQNAMTATVAVTVDDSLMQPQIAAVSSANQTITWQNVPNAVSYEVWINQIGINPRRIALRQQNIAPAAGTTTTFNIPAGTLVNGRHKVWVRAHGAPGTNGNPPPLTPSLYSKPVFFNIGTAPAAPMLNAPTNTANGLPVFTWTAAPTATHYELIVSQVGGLSGLIRQRNVQGTTFTTMANSFIATMPATNALPIGRYKVWLRGFNSVGAGTWTTATFFNVGIQPPAQVANVVYQPTAPQQMGLVMGWGQVAGAQSYEVWVNRVGGQSRVYHNKLIPPFTGVSLLPGQTTNLPTGNYRVWVRAISANGLFGAWSAATNFTV